LTKSTKELRSFGLTVGAAFLLFGSLAWFWRGHAGIGQALLGLGGVLIAGGLLVPNLLGPVERAWMGLAHAMSKVTTPIFMGVVYFVVFTPAGLLRRAVAGRVLDHNSGSTAWQPVKPSSSMERQF
jgi:hypothetical protein